MLRSGPFDERRNVPATEAGGNNQRGGRHPSSGRHIPGGIANGVGAFYPDFFALQGPVELLQNAFANPSNGPI
jgi:hypothetical protein